MAAVLESLPAQMGPEEEVEWTDECNELIGQVLETQGEIASLLKTHDDNTESLVQLKKQCDEEVRATATAAELWNCLRGTHRLF
jgi:hypothetical protein